MRIKHHNELFGIFPIQPHFSQLFSRDSYLVIEIKEAAIQVGHCILF